jgi:RNA polymerase sigma-70 factor (ECF subfamily)
MDQIESVQQVDEALAQRGLSQVWSSLDTADKDALAPPREASPRRSDTADLFIAHRTRLFGIAYRMLGTRADAEDLLQDVYLRWHQSATHDVQSPLAFLITITTRLCLDRLRSLKQQRAQYFGPWLPEPIVEDEMGPPDMQLELREKVSIGFLTVMECLGPEERAAFLLHDVFDYDYDEVARILNKKAPSCRQMVHRARERLREPRRRFTVSPETRERVLRRFLCAIETGDRQSVMALLAEEAEYMADGGGKVMAAIKVLRGQERLGWFYHCIARRFVGLRYRLVLVNGELGALCTMNSRLFSVLSFETDGDRIYRVYNVRNPDKLARVALRNSGD